MRSAILAALAVAALYLLLGRRPEPRVAPAAWSVHIDGPDDIDWLAEFQRIPYLTAAEWRN